MCAWRVLAMLRRVACVGACHLSPHHTTRFCSAAAGCACPSTRKHRDLCNSNLDTNTSLHLRPHGRFFNEYVSVFCFFAKIADDRRQHTTVRRAKRYRGRTMCACRTLSIMRRIAFVIACHVLSSCSLVPNTCCLHSILQ